MNELIIVNGNDIEIQKEVSKKIKKLITASIELEKIKSQLKEEMLSVMEANEIAKWENDYMTINYKKGGTRRIADTDKLKADGLYEEYSKTSEFKSSVTITLK